MTNTVGVVYYPMLYALAACIILGVVMGVFSMRKNLEFYNRMDENEIKRLKIESENPELAGVFAAYLRQWTQPRFRLPKRSVKEVR